MFLSYFTEQPMSAYPADEGLKAGYTSVLFSNKYFDPVEGAPPVPGAAQGVLARRRSRLRRHHGQRAPQRALLHAAADHRVDRILAAVTKRVKIVQLGNPLPDLRQSSHVRRRDRDDRHDLAGPSGLGHRARRWPRDDLSQREPRVQP